MEISEEVRNYLKSIGKKGGTTNKIRSKELYGDESEYFRQIAAKRKRFGRRPKNLQPTS